MNGGGLPGGPAPDSLRVAVCQVNPTVGDLSGNVKLAKAALARAEAAGADVAVLPEMTVTGYPPEDLVLRPGFVAASRSAVEEFASATGACAAVVGFADGAGESTRAVADMAGDGAGWFNSAYNAAAVCAGGRVHDVYRKRHLPNYDVFDEVRQFRSGDGDADSPALFGFAGAVVGITLCEDAWVQGGPLWDLADAGAQLVFTASASPFRGGKQQAREELMGRNAALVGVPVVYVNLVGGQDDLVFDGGSFAVAANGEVIVRCASFAESVDVFDMDLAPPQTVVEPQAAEHGAEASRDGVAVRPVIEVTQIDAAAGVPQQRERGRVAGPFFAPLCPDAECWAALVLATCDYVRKTGFSDVAVGLSGGVDSSLVAAIAVDALGAEHVHGVLMPSRYSSGHSVADAERLATNLGISVNAIGIDPAHSALADMLGQALDSAPAAGGLTDQNLQARIRGTTLMALANELGWLVLTTGNKSELSVGYSTLYGDTAGAYAVISDVWKLMVYDLCRWRNRQAGKDIIPADVLAKTPSAELAPGQRDDQSLPAYEVLDPILRLYVEESRGVAEIQALDIAPADEVARVCGLVEAAEYKRRQSPLGPRITGRAFGRDRRMPIVNLYR